MTPNPATPPRQHDALVVGAGLAGIVTALELLDRGLKVLLLERGDLSALGGQAMQAFGGMCLVDTPLQRLIGVKDSRDLALSDWLSFAQFSADDIWPRRWAEHYVSRCVPEVYEWLRGYGLRFIPAVQWVERGLYAPGNSVPRYHVLWGSSAHMATTLVRALREHRNRAGLTLLCNHRVKAFTQRDGAISGCIGVVEPGGEHFEYTADKIVVAAGGISGDLQRVRAHWPRDWGTAPEGLLGGSHPHADGALHDAVEASGGRVTHLDRMWNYAAGVAHTNPQFPGHGLSLIPAKSALWVDPGGRRIGPVPLVTGFDTRDMVERIARGGWPHTWQVLNRRIAVRELAASGAEHNPLIRDRRMVAFAAQMLRGNPDLTDQLLAKCPDFVQGRDLPELVQRMNALCGNDTTQHVQLGVLAEELRQYDAQIERGARFHNDDQLRRIAQLRRWLGDRLRTCNFQRIADPQAGPLIAIRCRILIRKSMGGIQTDLDSRVLDTAGRPIPGLYAVGEASGFGGGGSNGVGSLEGTFLSGCILTGRAAARHMAA